MSGLSRQQHQAQVPMRRLVFLYALAVCGVVWLMVEVLWLLLGGWTAQPLIASSARIGLALALWALILGASFWKARQLQVGGEVVAAAFLGQALRYDMADGEMQRLLNVVTEMAIAAGIALPKVYLLPDENINAFVAGNRQNEAVVGVSAGALAKLNRDELQALVAHEINHIVMGDMRFNMRMTSLLHGLMAISICGERLLSPFYDEAPSGWLRLGAMGSVFLAAVGAVMWLVGLFGVWAAQLIQAAIGREQQYRADRAVVKFMWQMSGLVGLLRKTRHDAYDGVVLLQAKEYSHFWFHNFAQHDTSPLASHPSLEARLARLSQLGSFEAMDVLSPIGNTPQAPVPEAKPTHTTPSPAAAFRSSVLAYEDLAALSADEPNVLRLPESVQEAQAWLYGFLLPKENIAAERWWQRLGEEAPAAMWLLPKIMPLPLIRAQQIVDVAAHLATCLQPLLRPEKQLLAKQLLALIAEPQVSMMQWTMGMVVLRALFPDLVGKQGDMTLSQALPLAEQCLWRLAQVAARNGQSKQAFARGALVLGSKGQVLPSLPEDFEALLAQLVVLQDEDKARLVLAAVAVVETDREIADEERQLIRALVLALDYPMPPLLLAERMQVEAT